LQTIIILFVLTIILTLILKLFVTPKYGTDVASRFLERLKYIPSQTALLSSTTLSGWLANKANSEAIRGYVYPVLFPLDILFLLSLGLLLGFASGALGSHWNSCRMFQRGSGGCFRFSTWPRTWPKTRRSRPYSKPSFR
jgi:hypothetical protein